MDRDGINLSNLRDDRVRRLIAQASENGCEPHPGEDVVITRRHLFGVAAVAGLSLSSASTLVNNLVYAAEGSLSWDVSQTRVVFRLGGRDRWVIDTSAFGFNPRLITRRLPGLFIVHLTGATFPGTCLPADFVCELHERTLSWRMKLSFQLGSFRTEVPFERWLLGESEAASSIHLDTSVCGLGLAGQFRLEGSGTASFAPNWEFEFAGSRLARYRGQEADVESDHLRLALIGSTTPSLTVTSRTSRTLLALERSAHRWSLAPEFESNGSGTVVYPDNVFQTVHFETWDDLDGTHACAMLAEGSTTDSVAWFHPDLDADHGEDPIAFPLTQVQYARLFHPKESTRQQVLRARFRTEPVSLKVLGCRLDVGAHEDTQPFELVQADGVTDACCEPAVHRLAVPFGGGIAEPIELPRGARLVWNGERSLAVPTAGPLDKARSPAIRVPIAPKPAPASPMPSPAGPKESIALTPAAAEATQIAVLSNFRTLLEVVGPFTVSVVRPEDLLVLKFEFRGWALQAAAGQQPKIGRNNPQATIVVHFPSQHIAEQAFFEPADPNQKERPVYPIQARLAGSSRLVFAVPTGIAEIPYALEALLDWSQFELVVTRAAAPPPPPQPPRVMGGILGPPGGVRKQSVIPQIAPRTVPREQPKKKQVPQPQSTPVPVPSGRFLWHVSNGDAKPFIRARAVLVGGYLHRVQLQPLRQSPGIVPKTQTPQQARPKVEGPVAVQKLPPELVILPPVPPKKEDLPNITAIEVPYRLFMSPSKMGGWAHALKPIALNNRFELWHTRLGVRKQLSDGRWSVDERDEWNRTLRAIWSPDYRDNPADSAIAPDPFRNLPEARHRHQLVHLMANGTIKDWEKRYARADRFMLSSLGAWMKTRYLYDPAPNPLTIIDWTQHTNMGRDQFVRVVEQGFLFPFGHRAVLIQITERKIERPIPGGPIVALLRYREFIVVREPVKTFPGPGQEQLSHSRGRNLPYQSLRLTTLITPNLDPKEGSAIPGVPPVAFWPKVSGQDFQFHIIGKDWAGDETEFSMPLVFVDSKIGLNSNLMKTVRNVYAKDPRSTTQLSGQKISFAPSVKKGDTALETASVTFSAEIPCDPTAIAEGLMPACPPAVINKLIAAVNPLFYPFMDRANVSIPAVKALLGANPASAGTDVRYSNMYRVNGFTGPNQGELFLVLLNPVGMRFTDTTKAGGLASPNMDIVGMSRLKGPVGGKSSGVTTRGDGGDAGAAQSAEKFGSGNFNPKEYFKDAKILGGIPLADIFPSANLDAFKKPGGLVPSLKSEEHPTKIKVPFEFTVDNVQKVNLAPVLIFDSQLPTKPSPKKSKFTLKVVVVFRFGQPGAGAVPEPEFNSEGELTNFQLTIAQVIRVSFRKLKLVKKHGESVSPHPELASESEDGVKPVEFLGALKFVSKLQELVGGKKESGGGGGGGGGGGQASGGGSSGWGVKPIIEPSLTSLKAGIAVTVPTVNVGVFSLSNLKLSAAVIIFWSGDPVRFRLAISERNDPFCITVWLFGGGGFFAVEIEASERGVVLVEVLLEFGGKFAFDIGIASGGVYVMAGFYFKYGLDSTTGQKGVYLEGYLRMGGQLNVLGLITVSLEFKMMIAYEEKVIGTTSTTKTISKKLWGEASLVVKIEILFFETSVTLRVQKEFQGETETVQIAQREHDYLWLVSNEARPYLMQNTVGTFVKPRKIYEMLSEQEWAQYAGAFAA